MLRPNSGKQKRCLPDTDATDILDAHVHKVCKCSSTDATEILDAHVHKVCKRPSESMLPTVSSSVAQAPKSRFNLDLQLGASGLIVLMFKRLQNSKKKHVTPVNIQPVEMTVG